MSEDRPNLPPADELHAVREQQAALEEREKTLRQLMISDPSSRTGNAHVAEIRELIVQRPDIAEMRKAYPDAVAEHTHAVKQLQVVLLDITEHGELVRRRRHIQKAAQS